MNTTARVIWRCIDNRRRRGAVPPNYPELMALTGLKSKTAIIYHLAQLERLGIIRRASGCERGITLLEPFCWFED